MTLKITGTAETLEDVEALNAAIRLCQESSDIRMQSLFWSAYPILIAWEHHVTGLYKLSEEEKTKSLANMIEEVNYILSTGIMCPWNEENAAIREKIWHADFLKREARQ